MGTQTLVGTPADRHLLSALPGRALDNLFVVATRDRPSELERRLERAGRDAAGVGVVPVAPGADGYDGDLWTTDPVRPGDLTGIGMRFADATRHVEPGFGWVMVDALDVLFVYADPSRVFRFLRTLSEQVRAREARGVYCVSPDAIPDATYEQLRSLWDVEYRA